MNVLDVIIMIGYFLLLVIVGIIGSRRAKPRKIMYWQGEI